MSGRGMKKWAPYSSLVEQKTFLDKEISKKKLIKKPVLSDERAQKINNILISYNGQTVRIRYFKEGHIFEIESRICRVDTLNRKIILPDKTHIFFDDLIDMNV